MPTFASARALVGRLSPFHLTAQPDPMDKDMADVDAKEKDVADVDAVPATEEAAATPEEEVDALVAGNPVVVFSKTYCPFCAETKSTLSSMGVDAKIVEVNLDEHGEALHKAVKAKTGHRTVPSVWIGGKHIGGNDSLQQLKAEGKLAKQIAMASASA